MADDAKHAIDVLFTRARSSGLLASDVVVDWRRATRLTT
jgi:hypothetical protein